MQRWQTNPLQHIIISHGEGCRVWDTSGKSYLDLLSGTWCNMLGYGNPHLTKAISMQSSKIAHSGAPLKANELDLALSKPGEMAPPELNRAVFFNTGSEAVERALKMARAATRAEWIVIIERGYYGAATYALSVSEIGLTAKYLPFFGNVLWLPAPNCLDCPMGLSWPCNPNFVRLNPLADLAEKGGKQVAAVLYESVMGNGGILVPPKGYGARLRELTWRRDTLLVAEEVTTGMGRTGSWLAFDRETIVPDILVIGKAIGAGFPVSVVVSSSDAEM